MKAVRLSAILGIPVIVLLSAGWWVFYRSDVTEYPSQTANARLDVLQQDALVPEVGKYLGLTPSMSRMQCRDTPDGLEAPTLEAMFQGNHPPLSAEKVQALAQAAGWHTVFTNQPGSSGYSVQLQKSFGSWESNTVVTVVPSSVSIDLDASVDGSCP
ncbi:hypothetical protein [Kitasatospora sp. NPDC051914]|uniref:hypothetical protein n=1 Tax=Kitasatospora sp. NPDC051914 TaxID=3154945 RepID=UPI00343A1825